MRSEAWLRCLSSISICVAIAVAAGGAWSTKWQSPINEHLIYISRLQFYRESISKLQRDVLLVTTGRLLSYDPLVADLNLLREGKSELLKLPSYLNSAQKKDLLDSISDLDKTLAQADGDLSIFMQKNSILKNSMYFLNQSVRNETIAEPDVSAIYETISYFNLPDNDIKKHLLSQLSQAKLNPYIIKHIRIVLDKKGELDEVLSRLLSDHSERYLDSLFANYLLAYEQATKPAETGRLWLYVIFVAILMCLAVYVIERLAWSMKLVKIAEAKYREIFEEASDGIFRLNSDMTTISANPALRRFLGVESEEATLTMLKEITLSPANAAISKHVLENFSKKGEVTELEVCLELPGGTKPRWFILNARMRNQYIDGSILDISTRKEAEHLFEEFYAFISHELRTPLTSIVGSLELIESGKLSQEKVSTMFQSALRNSERLVRLVNDLLDMKKVQSGKFELFKEEVSFLVVLNAAISAISGLGSKKKFALDISGESEIELCLDCDRVTQVLINLLSNAIKFSPENSKISIVIKRETLNENDRLLCSIIDHGAGVAVEEIENLFQRFSQIKPSDNLTFIKGSGLGLFISRSIIEQHGGEIGYTPNPDGGSIFWFSLPIVGADS